MIRVALILGCIIFASSGNLLLKSGMKQVGDIAKTELTMSQYARQVFTRPQILLGGVLYIASALMWMALLSGMEISAVYPIFVSAAFLIVMVGSAVLFREHLGVTRIIGTAVMIVGIFIVSRTAQW